MRKSNPYDVVIIGAGVVGCAMARRFTLDGAQVLVLEKAADVLDGASKGNSAILHTGFDAPPGSLEQSCIAAGYAEYLDVAKELSLPILKSGAMVVAWDNDQLAQLPKLVAKAHQNGVADVQLLNRQEILQREPNLSPTLVGGFLVPGEYLIDPWASPHAYLLQALANGAELRRKAEVTEGRFENGVWVLETGVGTFHAAHVVNCAGLYGDVVDKRLLGRHDFTVTPRKGQFVVYDKPASKLVSSIILPVPTATTKGVVVCRTIFGNVLVGPTAEDQESRTDASTHRETLVSLHDKGVEMLPSLANCEVTTTYAGLRPATEFPDYQIRDHGQGYVTVGGIRSTGLSAALGIARHVAEMVGLNVAPLGSPKVPVPDRLSNYHPRDWESADQNDIICHCELVTRQEVEQILNGLMRPATMQGLKRRTRAMMGRCQGFNCSAQVLALAKEYLEDEE